MKVEMDKNFCDECGANVPNHVVTVGRDSANQVRLCPSCARAAVKAVAPFDTYSEEGDSD